MTQNNNPFTKFMNPNDFTKLFENYQGQSPFDVKSLMETQAKNFEALNKAQQITVENIQAIAQCQSEMLSQIAEDNSILAKEIIAEGSPEEKIAKNAELFKSVCERSINNMNKISELMNQSGVEASTLINKRVSASINEIQSSLESAGVKTNKASKKAA